MAQEKASDNARGVARKNADRKLAKLRKRRRQAEVQTQATPEGRQVVQTQESVTGWSVSKQVTVCILTCMLIYMMFGYLAGRDWLNRSPDAKLRNVVDRTTNELQRYLETRGSSLNTRRGGWSVIVESETDFKKRLESPLVATLTYRFVLNEERKPGKDGYSSYRIDSCKYVYRYSQSLGRWVCVSQSVPLGNQRRYRFISDEQSGYWRFSTSEKRVRVNIGTASVAAALHRSIQKSFQSFVKIAQIGN